MTAYNDLRFVDAAVASVLSQHYQDFELIVVDDGSGQHSVFARLSAKDARIRILTCERNIGTYAAANLGISQSSGEIIARLDADDLCEPSRLARSVDALDLDPELGLVGSSVTLIDEADAVRGAWDMPVTDLDVRWNILFRNPFCHSAIAFRRTCFDAVGGYQTTMRQSEDYVLWTRMLDVCRGENIPEPLVRYRQNSRGLSAANPPNWRERTDWVRQQAWVRLGVAYEPDLLPDLEEFVAGRDIVDPAKRARAHRIVCRLLTAFLAKPRILPREIDDAAALKLESMILDRIVSAVS